MNYPFQTYCVRLTLHDRQGLSTADAMWHECRSFRNVTFRYTVKSLRLWMPSEGCKSLNWCCKANKLWIITLLKQWVEKLMFSLLPLVSLHWGITNCSFYCLGSLLSSNTPHSEIKSSSFSFSYKAFGLHCQKNGFLFPETDATTGPRAPEPSVSNLGRHRLHFWLVTRQHTLIYFKCTSIC